MFSQLESDLNLIKQTKDPFEKADLIKKTISTYKLTLSKLSKKIGLTPSYIAHYLRLLKLPDLIVDGYYSGSVSLSHLFVISRLKNQADMETLYEEVLLNNLSVKQTEDRVRFMLHNISSSEYEYYLPANEIENIKKELIRILGPDVNVLIKQTRIKAKIQIEFKGNLFQSNKFLKKLHKILKRLG